MRWVKLECEIISPMFLSGANIKNCELRPPSVKGVLRYWWRATHEHLRLPDLKIKEYKIFGGAGKESKQSDLFIDIPQRTLTSLKLGEKFLLPHKKEEREKVPRNAFLEGSTFVINLGLKSERNIELTQVKALFLLLSVLGGLGKRTRRGMGSFRVLSIDEEEEFYNYNLKSCNLDFVLNLLRLIVTENFADKYQLSNGKIINPHLNKTENKYPFITEIAIGKTANKLDDLLDQINKISKKYDCYYTGFAEGQKRLASPVYISVVKDDSVNSATYAPIVTNLYLPEISLPDNVNEAKNVDKRQALMHEVLTIQNM